jgi:DNA-binding NarL/FixJ family response regulator
MQKEKIRIAIADYDPSFRHELCQLLTPEEDFEMVAQAQDGRQVLDVLQQYEHDILFLDLKMPGARDGDITRQFGIAFPTQCRGYGDVGGASQRIDLRIG